MGSAYKIVPHYTYADYCHWEGRWELIDGIAHAMAPMARPEHQAVATNLGAELRAALKKASCNCKVYQPLDYKLSEDTVLNPDLLLLCRPVEKKFLDFPPALVVEILSPATAMNDRHTKFQLYQQQQIPYYLIVDVDAKKVELYRFCNSQYELQAINQQQPYRFQLSDACAFELVVDAIWE